MSMRTTLKCWNRCAEQLWQKAPELWKANNRLLCRDNAPAHRSFKTPKFLAYYQTTILEHPVYSSDLAPNDVSLYLKIKEMPKGTHFAGKEILKTCESAETYSRRSVPWVFQFMENLNGDVCKAWSGVYWKLKLLIFQIFQIVHVLEQFSRYLIVKHRIVRSKLSSFFAPSPLYGI